MRIKQAAQQLGISAAWLKELEAKRRIPPAKRDLNHHRRYSGEDIRRLTEILYGKSTGTRPQQS
ncbi:MAG: MerR family transcriptional regulator [Nitrospinae bacterium]|nr:MerR family transcriptional regulator [Nitrospinota bacterium]